MASNDEDRVQGIKKKWNERTKAGEFDKRVTLYECLVNRINYFLNHDLGVHLDSKTER